MRTRRSIITDSSDEGEESKMEVDSSSDSSEDDDIIKDEDEEDHSKQITIESPSSFEQIPIIKLDSDYFMTAIYVKKFLQQSDYDLLKAFKKFGKDKDRRVLQGTEMKKLVKLSKHNYLSSDLEIKPNIKGVVLFRMDWIVQMFNREILINELVVHQVDISDFSIVFDMDVNCVNFKDDIIESILEEEEALQQENEVLVEISEHNDEDTFHTCPIRTQGIEKFQDFLHGHINTTSEKQVQIRIIAPFDY